MSRPPDLGGRPHGNDDAAPTPGPESPGEHAPRDAKAPDPDPPRIPDGFGEQLERLEQLVRRDHSDRIAQTEHADPHPATDGMDAKPGGVAAPEPAKGAAGSAEPPESIEPVAQAKPDAKPETDAKGETPTEAQPDAKTQPDAKAGTDAKAEADTKVEPAPEKTPVELKETPQPADRPAEPVSIAKADGAAKTGDAAATKGRNRHTLGISDLNRMSIDNDGRLYWDGKPVEVSRRLLMSREQIIAAALFAAIAVIGAAGAAFQAYATAYDWACKRGWTGTYCPSPPKPPDIPA